MTTHVKSSIDNRHSIDIIKTNNLNSNISIYKNNLTLNKKESHCFFFIVIIWKAVVGAAICDKNFRAMYSKEEMF